MSTTRPLTVSITTWGRVALSVAGAICVLLFALPATAGALTVGVGFPASVTVGQPGLTAHVTLTNTNALPAAICNVGQCDSQGILVVPSCGSASPPGTC